MKRVLFWLLAVTALIAAVPLSFMLLFAYAISSETSRTVYSRALSPDGMLEARVQFDDCGATCDFSRVVFIKRHGLGDEPSRSCRAFWAKGEEPVSLEWTGNRTLLVRHGFQASEVQDAPDHCGDVKVEAVRN